jgi:hypothetical protein
VTRLDLEPHRDTSLARTGIARRIYLPDHLASVPRLLDGTRRLSEIAATLQSHDGASATLRLRELEELTYRLLCMGACSAVSKVG